MKPQHYSRNTTIRNKALQAVHRDTGLGVSTLQRLTRTSIKFTEDHYTIHYEHNQKLCIMKNSPYHSYAALRHWVSLFKDNDTNTLFFPLNTQNAFKNTTPMSQSRLLSAIKPYYNPTRKQRTPKTKTNYAGDIALFKQWCATHKITPEAITEEQALAWIREKITEQKQSLGTILNARCAVSYYLKKMGRLKSPTNSAPIRLYIRDEKRKHGRLKT